MIFGSSGGLSNQLRAIFSRFRPGDPLTVQWDPYWATADGRFLDVFEPIPGLTFVEFGAPKHVWWAEEGPDTWHENYKLLRPTAALRERIAGIAESLGPYHAMHVRRTDHTIHCVSQNLRATTDQEFITWAHARTGPVFLATDNTETRETMLRAVGPRLVWQGPMEASLASKVDARRYNSLADAVVDMFVCVEAEEFLGTTHSSFSDLIQHLRKVRC